MAHDSPLPPVDRWGECDALPEPRSRQRRFSVQAILAAVLGLAVLLPLLRSGAGSLQVLRSTPSYGAVAGRVTYHGKPVSALLILHKPHGGPFAVVQCDKEGRYSMPRLALGEATITLVVTTLWASPRENSMIHFDALSNDALLAAGTVAAQAPPPYVSPEIGADRALTLRYFAPNARDVVAGGELDGKPHPMTKGADGIWTVTVGPLAPDIYTYAFNVDGSAIFQR